MEKYLQDIEVWCWRYKGSAPGYQGLHFTAKPEACDAIAYCLNQLRQEGAGAYRTIHLKHLKPEDEAKVTGGRKYRCFPRLRVALHNESNVLRQMSFRVEDEIVYLDFKEICVSEFELALSDVKAGIGDYSIFPCKQHRKGLFLGELDKISEPLWFWPCFGHLCVMN